MRTGAVCKKGKVVHRQQHHKSVSRPGRAQEAAAGSALRVGWPCRHPPQLQVRRGWLEARGRPEHPSPSPHPPLGTSYQVTWRPSSLPSRSLSGGSKGRRRATGARPPRGVGVRRGIVFGSEEVPAQPSKFCPKADKRIGPR